jgi:hypothetical protein
MRLGIGDMMRDALALWRRERELLLPLAGVFLFLPMLAIVLLLAGSGLMDTPPERVREAVQAFYAANVFAILAANLGVQFGTCAVLNLFLRGDGRTLGQVLGAAALRFLPFVVLDLMPGLLLSLGLSLLVVPGLFGFARTWLAAPAYVAQPQAGLLAAVRDGWRRSAGFSWVTLLAASALVLGFAALLVVVASVMLGLVESATGANVVLTTVAYLVTALIGAFAWTALALLRVSAYRLAEPRQGT